MKERIGFIQKLIAGQQSAPPAETEQTDRLKTKPLAIAHIKPGEHVEDHRLLKIYKAIDMAG